MTVQGQLTAVRAAYGAGLLLLPRSVLGRLARMRLDGTDVAVARVLGLRQLAQAVILWRRPDLITAGAGVDALHAASMVAVSRVGRDAGRRTLARRNARTAGLLAVLGVIAG